MTKLQDPSEPKEIIDPPHLRPHLHLTFPTMLTVSVNRNTLLRNLKREYTDKDFTELCFQFGVKLDEITSEREEAEKFSMTFLSKKRLAELDVSVVHKIDVLVNRYDLLCMEECMHAVRIFLPYLNLDLYLHQLPHT